MANSYLAEGKTMTDEQKRELLEWLKGEVDLHKGHPDCIPNINALRRLVERWGICQEIVADIEKKYLKEGALPASVYVLMSNIHLNPFEEGEK